jgi:protein TonB
VTEQLTKFPSLASEPDRFGRAFLVALALELALFAAFAFAPRPAPPVAPATVQLKIIAPPAPVAAVKPPPPVPPPPLPPPPPVPTPPMPVAPPLPIPPPPPLPNHPTEHRIIRHQVYTPPPPAVQPPPDLPPAPQTAAPPPIAPPVNPTAMARYTGELRTIVLSNLIVPAQLTVSGLSSDCVLRFTLSPDGEILSAEIATPSGLASVNEAALNALRASHFPAFIAGMPAGDHSFTLPVHVSGEDQ